MKKVLTEWNGYNFFFAIKNSDSWAICPYKFILSHTDDTLYGQYISSLWFKKSIPLDCAVEMAIVKLPPPPKVNNYINIMNYTNTIQNLDFVLGYTKLTKERLVSIYTKSHNTMSWCEELNEILRMSFSYPRTIAKNQLYIYCPSFSLPL